MVRQAHHDCANAVLRLRLLSIGFLYPEEIWRRRLESLLWEVDIPTVRSAWLFNSPVDLLSEYSRLFGSSGACPLELAFHMTENPFEQAKIMAQFAGFHKAFGVDAQEGMRPDHLSVVLEFLGYLYLKRANAVQKGLAEAKEVTEKAIGDYVREFCGPGANAFSLKLREQSQNTFYRGLADLLMKEIQTTCELS